VLRHHRLTSPPFFDRRKEQHLTVAEAWELYEPITKRDNAAWQTDVGRAAHLVRHLGDRQCVATSLSLEVIESDRTARLGEKTVRGTPPTPGTLDREVELLKRFLNYDVRCGRLDRNPIGDVALLKVSTRVRAWTHHSGRDLVEVWTRCRAAAGVVR
jgi:hypothetical protein